MKTPFQLIDEIRKVKKPYALQIDDAFAAPVIQKGLSMQSPKVCELLCQTTNKWLYSCDNQQLMDIWKLLIPKSNFYFPWISKKDKEKKNKDAENAELIKKACILMECSPKYIKSISEFVPDFLDQFKEEKLVIKQKLSVE